MAFKRKNIAILSNEIGIEIEVIDTEVPTGSFSADILALESGSDKKLSLKISLKKQTMLTWVKLLHMHQAMMPKLLFQFLMNHF